MWAHFSFLYVVTKEDIAAEVEATFESCSLPSPNATSVPKTMLQEKSNLKMLCICLEQTDTCACHLQTQYLCLKDHEKKSC